MGPDREATTIEVEGDPVKSKHLSEGTSAEGREVVAFHVLLRSLMSEERNANRPDAMRAAETARRRLQSVDPRSHAAWKSWLGALATDANAAAAAALAYESLPPEGRVAWLDALDADASQVKVPAVALYAPLLGVEADEARRARISYSVAEGAPVVGLPRAFVASDDGCRVCAIVSPLYLKFVELLICRYDPDEGVIEATHDWLTHEDDLALRGRQLGVTWDETPIALVVEELAHAVVADRRNGRPPHQGLLGHIDLFAPAFEPGEPQEPREPREPHDE